MAVDLNLDNMRHPTQGPEEKISALVKQRPEIGDALIHMVTTAGQFGQFFKDCYLVVNSSKKHRQFCLMPSDPK
jgi:hypothetical protein